MSEEQFTSKRKPAWHSDSGTPANLEAAALDACEWLKVLRKEVADGRLKLGPRNHSSAVEKLDACVREVERFVHE